jgi:adenine-specific DNA-methyltransferase
LFPIKIRHVERQLMINATFHDVFEYLLIYRRDRRTRFQTARKQPRLEKFRHAVAIRDDSPEICEISGKRVEIFRPGQYELSAHAGGTPGLRRYVIAGKLATANWSGEWYETHLRSLGDDLLIRVWGLEREGLGYRWFQTGNERRRSGVYFQSIATAGRPILPSNDIDYTEVVPTVYREGGPGCDFKDSKKPEVLLQLLMSMCTQRGDLVIDFFAGSGTTLAVGIKTGRPVIAVENDPNALGVIATRLGNLRNGKDLDGVKHRFQIKTYPPR